MNIIVSIIFGALTGWLAGKIMNTDYSLLMNILIGICGSAIGHMLFGLLGFYATGIADIIVSVTGACMLIAVARKVAR